MLFFHQLQHFHKISTENSNDNSDSSNFSNSNLQVLKLEKAQELATTLCGMSSSEVKPALKFFHDSGFFLYFDTPELQHVLFLEPQQLIRVLRCIVTSTKPHLHDSFKKTTATEITLLQTEGRLKQSTLKKLWEDYPSEILPQLQNLLKQFGLALTDPSQSMLEETERDLIVPCLVENTKDGSSFFTDATTCVCMLHGVPPLGFQSQLVVQLLDLVSKAEQGTTSAFSVFKGGCVFSLDGMRTRITIQVGKITIQFQKNPKENSKLISGFKKLFEEINALLEKEHAKELQEVLAYCFHPNCEDNTRCDVVVNWRENLSHISFFCRACQESVPVHTIRFFDFIQTRPGLLNALGNVLDATSAWRTLGEHINVSVTELDRLETARNHDTKFSPTASMLKEWHSEDATVDNLIKIFRELMNNFTAADMLINSVEDKSTTEHT